MTLLFKRCSLTEFGEILRSGEIETLRREQGVLIECPVPGFDNHVINVFAPKDHVLWNLDFYPRFQFSEHAFYQKYWTPEIVSEVDQKLKRIVKSAGFPARSNFAIRMMGGWMGRMEFTPKPLQIQTLDSMHRHFSVVVPDSRLDAVREHFHLQSEAFEDNAFVRYEEKLPDPSRFDDLTKTREWMLLAQSPEYLMEEKDKNFLYEEAERFFGDPIALENLINSLDPRWAIRGLVRLHGIVNKSDIRYVDMERFKTILRFHLSVALRICSVPTLASKLFNSFGDPQHTYPDGIQEELLRKISDRLLPYKEIVDFDLDSCPMKYPMKMQYPMRYYHLQPDTEMPVLLETKPFKAIVVVEQSVTPNWQNDVSRWLVESGCRYVMAWGCESDSWAKSVEGANLDIHSYQEIPQSEYVIATSRTSDALQEVFWLAKHCAKHPAHDLNNTIILHMASNEDQTRIERLYESAWAPVNARQYGEAIYGA